MLNQQLYASYHAGSPSAVHSPIHGGIWIRNMSENMEGTLGTIVKVGGIPYMLTCQHVALPGGPFTNQYDIVTQPPVEYPNARIIGKVFRAIGPPAESVVPTTVDPYSIKSADIPPYTDAALIEITAASYSYDIPGVGIPKGIIAPKAGMQVKMLGARSGYHTGTILNSDFKVITKQDDNYIILNHLFTYNINHIEGDSGAAVVDIATNKVVGMAQGIAIFDDGKTKVNFCTRADYTAQQFGADYTGTAGTFGTEQNVRPNPGDTPTDCLGCYTNQTNVMNGVIILGGALLAGFLLSVRI